LATRKSSSRLVTVPDSIKALYLMKIAETGPLSDPSFYNEGLMGYSIWSFPLHRKALQQVLSLVPEGELITAPADGLGLTASMWSPVIAGDRAITSHSHRNVFCEQIDETMRRGVANGSQYLILAYCQQFMTDQEISYARKSFPYVFVIEANDAIAARWPMHRIGQHVYSTIKAEMEIVNDDTQQGRAVLFSENILQEGYVVTKWSPPLRYAYQMNPFMALKYEGNCERVLPERGCPQRYFAFTIAEAIRLSRSGKRVYLYQTGNEFEMVRHLETFTSQVCLDARVVYSIPRDRWRPLKGAVYEEIMGRMYFSLLKKTPLHEGAQESVLVDKNMCASVFDADGKPMGIIRLADVRTFKQAEEAVAAFEKEYGLRPGGIRMFILEYVANPLNWFGVVGFDDSRFMTNLKCVMRKSDVKVINTAWEMFQA